MVTILVAVYSLMFFVVFMIESVTVAVAGIAGFNVNQQMAVDSAVQSVENNYFVLLEYTSEYHNSNYY